MIMLLDNKSYIGTERRLKRRSDPRAFRRGSDRAAVGRRDGQLPSRVRRPHRRSFERGVEQPMSAASSPAGIALCDCGTRKPASVSAFSKGTRSGW